MHVSISMPRDFSLLYLHAARHIHVLWHVRLGVEERLLGVHVEWIRWRGNDAAGLFVDNLPSRHDH